MHKLIKMPSQIITPPDIILTGTSILIINALDDEVENLILYLRTQQEEYDIHLYHAEMFDDKEWAIKVAKRCNHILLNYKYQRFIESDLSEVIHTRAEVTTSYGNDTPCPDIIHFFTKLPQKV